MSTTTENCILPLDLDEARRFFDFMIEDGEGLTLQTFHDSKRDRKDVARVMHSGLDANIAELSRLQRDGAGVFWMVNEGDGAGRQEVNVTAVRYLFADTDGAPLAPLLTLPPHMVVQSSPGRYHVYWRVVDCPLDRFKPVQRAIAEKFGTDKSVSDLPRVMRVPGFIHQKDTPFLVKIRDIGNIPPYTLDDVVTGLGLSEKPIIEKVLPAPVPGAAFDFGRARKAAWDAARRTHEDASCSRHGEVFNLGCHLFRDGLPAEDSVFEYALQEFASHMRPTDASGRAQGMDFSAERKTIRDGYQRAHRDQGEAPDISGILGSIAVASAAPAAASSVWPAESGSIAAYLDTPPPELHWFAHERLLANRAHLLTGVGGTSKTTCLYHLGIGAVTGRVPWGWQIDRTGAALLLLAEDDAGNVHRTISNHVRHSDLSSAEQRLIAERLHVFPMAGRSCRLLSAGSNGTLHETAEARGLFALAKRIPDLRFIALDPALALTEGDEMSPAHQRRLGEFVDRLALETDACVVLASHAAKGVTTLDEVGSHTSRGSGAITDAVRGELVLRTMTASEAKSFGISDLAERKAHVQLVLTKSNAAPPRAFVPIWLRRGEGGLLSLADLGEEIARSPVGVREQRALEVLRKLASLGAPKLKEWREACEQEGLITAPNPAAADKAMQRIKSVLLASSLIESGMGKGVFVPVYEAE